MQKESSASIASLLVNLTVMVLLVDKSVGNPRSEIIRLSCDQQLVNNQTQFVVNFVQTMEKIGIQIQTSNAGTAVAGAEPDSSYALAQCYGNISTHDCLSCYALARTALPTCLPNSGGQIFLDGCFVRFQNYSFFEEYAGPNDTLVCGNTTRKSGIFQDSTTLVVLDTLKESIRRGDYEYFAIREIQVPGTVNEFVYVLIDCWKNLDASSCRSCLENASTSILQCLPWSEGRALNTGCFMRYSDTNFLNPDPASDSNRGKVKTTPIAIGSVLAFGTIIIVVCAWEHRKNRERRGGSNDNIKMSKTLNKSCLNFKYSTIKKAMGSFDNANKLGHGGFGAVYKGVLPDGKEIAAKRLFFNNTSRTGDFYHEVNIISSVDHKNLVRLLGYSCSGPESLLIYEYLPNRSLDHFIFDSAKGKELNWEKRFDIIIGTAEGLAYLHENTKTRIIHRDIKAGNILLDSKLHAKIADFGLARSFQEDKNHISTGIAGTLGYMAPEYVAQGQLTEKVDAYSYGVLLLEVVTGKRNTGIKTLDSVQSLLSIVWKHYNQGSVEEVFDPNLVPPESPSSILKMEVQRVVHIGLLCTQEIPSLRPTMSMVLQMLAKNIEPLPFPTHPPYIIENNIQQNDPDANPGLWLRSDHPASVPTVSHSTFHPR